ncbi:hypothetical protein ACFQZ4_46085 [Catellatospora coxensis]
MAPTTTTADEQAAVAYRFTRFRTALLIDDLTFARGAPGPGDRVPAFDLPVLDGGRFRDTDLGLRPVLLVFGSRTCPVTESAARSCAASTHASANRCGSCWSTPERHTQANCSASPAPSPTRPSTPKNCVTTTACRSRSPSTTSMDACTGR